MGSTIECRCWPFTSYISRHSQPGRTEIRRWMLKNRTCLQHNWHLQLRGSICFNVHLSAIVATFLTTVLKQGHLACLAKCFSCSLKLQKEPLKHGGIAEVSLYVLIGGRQNKTKKTSAVTCVSSLHNIGARLFVRMENKPFTWCDAALSDGN